MPPSACQREIVVSSSPPLCSFRNVLFSLLGVVSFLAVMWWGGAAVSILLEAGEKPDTVVVTGGVVEEESYDGSKGTRFIIGMVLMLIVSCLWAVFLVCITLYLGTRVVKFVFVLFILLSVFGGVIMFADERDELVGVILMCLAVVAVLFFLSVRHKLDFMGANLRVACAEILSSSTILYLAGAVLAGLLFWSIFWTLFVYGFSTNENDTDLTFEGKSYPLHTCTTYFVDLHGLQNVSLTKENYLPTDLKECDVMSGCYSCYCDEIFIREGTCFAPSCKTFFVVLCLISYYYISIVLAHAVHSASAFGAVKWWMKGNVSASDMLLGYRMAFTYWLGAVCIGSLLVPPIRTFYSAVYITMRLLHIDTSTGRPRDGTPSHHFSNCADCLFFLLKTLENSVISYNRYAFSFLAMHDSQHDFTSASKSVSHLFAGRGFTSLVHDTVLENIIMLACTSSGILGMLLATMYITLVEDDLEGNVNGALPLCCFVISYLTSLVLLQVVLGSTSAMYVCLAEDPDSLQTHHPHFFEPFVSAWRKHYPEANVTISNFSNSHSKFSVDDIPVAYTPPAVPLRKMGMMSSISGEGSTKQSQRYEKVSRELSDDDDSGSDDAIVTTNGQESTKEIDNLLENYALSQLPAQNRNLFSSPERKKNPKIFDPDNNEFVL